MWSGTLKLLPEDVTIVGGLAQDQVDYFLEFYAAWEPLNGDYMKAREVAERRLAGRKALRDFQSPKSEARRPKSPLDPSRDCVVEMGGKLTVPRACNEDPVWLKERETLDAVSLLKRVKGVKDHSIHGMPSTTDMAVHALLPVIEQKASGALDALKTIANGIREMSLGTCFFPSRVDEALKGRADQEKFSEQRVKDLKAQIAGHRKTVLDALKLPEMPAYYAILTADGDHMGEFLSRFDEAEHKKISKALTEFVTKVGGIVVNHRGHKVYAGGDDVLALLPVTEAVDCARDLEEAFLETLSPIGGATPTLSVGIAVVHHMNPLQVSVGWAREAEGAAKIERNSLSVALHTRGGAPAMVALHWPAKEWQDWADAFERGLTRGLPYELRELAEDFKDVELVDESRRPTRIREEAERIIKRKDPKKEVNTPGVPQWVQDEDSLDKFAQLLVISRFLSTYKEILDA
jgi:CRISPR-associated protein Cmr2